MCSKAYYLVGAAVLSSLLFPKTSLGQGLPPLTPVTLGGFTASSKMSVTTNDPGVNSSYTIVGGGNELWGDLDKGQFAYFNQVGDFDLKVRIESLEAVHRYAKSGLIVREGVRTTNRMVSVFATPVGPTELPTDNPVGADNVEFNFRRARNDGKNSINLGSPGFPNAWLRLARRGTVFYGLVGPDGTNWTRSGSVDTSSWPGGAFASNVFLGLGASSHDDLRTVRTEIRDFSAVTAVGKIQFSQQPTNVVALAGQSVTLTAAIGDPVDASYQWYANDVPIPGATNLTLTLPETETPAQGTLYHVTATGPAGTVNSSKAALNVVEIESPANPIAVFDFDDGEIPFGTAVYDTALVDPASGFGGSGGLILTTNLNNQNGSFVIDDLNIGSTVNSFTVAFKMKIGPGSSNPADGVSLSFGTNLPNSTFVAPQQGVGPGLAIAFDIYDNGNSEAPAIDVFYGVDPAMVPQNLAGNILHQPLSKTQLVNSRFVDVVVRMNPDGKLDLVYDGTVVAYQLQTPFVPVTGGRFGFAAYCGGQNAQQSIDEISIETTTLTSDAYLQSFAPLGNAVAARPEIVASLVDLATVVDTNSIHLQFNEQTVTPQISKEAETTLVRYAVPERLPPNSTNTATLIWSDDASNPHTNTFSFKVANYATLPAQLARPLGSGQAENLGFKVRVYQIGGPLDTSSAAAQDALAGRKGPNLAKVSGAEADGYFVDPLATSVINYDVNPSDPEGLGFPGIPGSTDSKENFAAEVLALIEFPSAGYYEMAVRSDDGFRLTVGSPGDPNAVLVGAFEGAREPLDTIFGFDVPQAGIYPFRLLYYQGAGGAMLRWSSVGPNGEQTLLNDPEQPEAWRVYRSIDSVSLPSLTVTKSGSEAVLAWEGTAALESAEAVNGPWTSVAGATSPYHFGGGGTKFFRLHTVSGP